MSIRFIISALAVWLWTYAAHAQQHAPEIRNLVALADTTAGEVYITYDLIDPDSREVEVLFKASNDGGKSWLVYTHTARGDLGKTVRPGKNKRIIWAYNRRAGKVLDFKLKLIADDGEKDYYRDISKSVSQGRLKQHVETLEGTRHYLQGAPGLEIAQKLLTHQWLGSGFDVQNQGLVLGSYEGKNITAIKHGHEDETILVMTGAFYDTHPESPGANDNASGLAVMLEASHLLSGYQFKKSIVFAGFDLQKQGGIGSTRYVNRLTDQQAGKIEGVFLLDNVGVFSDEVFTQQFSKAQRKMFPQLTTKLERNQWRGNFLFLLSDENSIRVRNTFGTQAELYAPKLKFEALKVPTSGTEEVLFGNDLYRAFWKRNIPATLITDGAESRNTSYEQNGDQSEILNYERMSEVAIGLATAMANQAGIIHGDVETCEIGLKHRQEPKPLPDHLVDYHLYLTDQNSKLKVRINHPEHGRLQLRLMDTKGEVFYHSKIDLYYHSVINIDISYLPKGVYLVNLASAHFDELKEFILQ